MINLISVNNSSAQNIGVTPVEDIQRIVIKNVEEQKISIQSTYGHQDIEIAQDLPQKIPISMPCPCKLDVEAAIEAKVPKALSILPQASSEEFATAKAREASRVYVDVDGKPKFVNLEQIKELNTKIILVDDLADKKIDYLSNGDFVLLEERR